MLVFIFFSLFAPLLALAQDTQHTNSSAFPECAKPCIAAGITASPYCWSTNHACATAYSCDVYNYTCLVINGCGYTNDTCVCGDNGFADATAKCTTDACNAHDRQAVADTANSQCAQVPGHLDFSADDNQTMTVSPAASTATLSATGVPTVVSAPPSPSPYTGNAGKMKMVAGFMMGTLIGVVSALVML